MKITNQSNLIQLFIKRVSEYHNHHFLFLTEPHIINETWYYIMKGPAALQSHFHVSFTVPNYKSQTFCVRKLKSNSRRHFFVTLRRL